MTEFDHTPTQPSRPPSDPSVDDLPGEPDEADVERGSADGSAKHNQVLEESVEDAGAATGAGRTTDDEDPSVS